MKSSEALRELAEVTASQWGMVTTAQAHARGVDRLTLSRLTEAGHLERLAHGVYRDAGAPGDEFEDLRAAWLSTDPKPLAEERLRNLTDGVVVAAASAALLHGVGDLWANRHEFVTGTRRQTQRTQIRYRQRRLDNRDVTLVAGLPVMTLERTLADLLDDVGELSLVADALGAAVKRRSLNLDRLRELLGPLAERNGFARHDGNAVLEHLLETAGLDLDSVARRLSEDSVLGPRIATNFLQQMMPAIDMSAFSAYVQHITPPIPSLPDELARGILHALWPQLALAEQSWKALSNIVVPDLSTTVAEIVRTSALANLSQQWATGLAALPAAAFARDAARTRREDDA